MDVSLADVELLGDFFAGVYGDRLASRFVIFDKR